MKDLPQKILKNFISLSDFKVKVVQVTTWNFLTEFGFRKAEMSTLIPMLDIS
jgi:hypothetical protein